MSSNKNRYQSTKLILIIQVCEIIKTTRLMNLFINYIVVNICILSSVRSRLGQGCCGHSWETVLSEDESISWFIKLDELMEDPRTFEMDQESSYFFHNIVHEIVHLDSKLLVRDFYVLRSHMDRTRFEPFDLTLNSQNHCYSTLFEPTNFSQS